MSGRQHALRRGERDVPQWFPLGFLFDRDPAPICDCDKEIPVLKNSCNARKNFPKEKVKAQDKKENFNL
jgi:hypothetical protein